MDRQFRTWTAEGERLWLSMLVGAMEQASQHGFGARDCELRELAGLRAQLACPASPFAYGGSIFSLRN
jgi:hypothetical protein